MAVIPGGLDKKMDRLNIKGFETITISKDQDVHALVCDKEEMIAVVRFLITSQVSVSLWRSGILCFGDQNFDDVDSAAGNILMYTSDYKE